MMNKSNNRKLLDKLRKEILDNYNVKIFDYADTSGFRIVFEDDTYLSVINGYFNYCDVDTFETWNGRTRDVNPYVEYNQIIELVKGKVE